MKEVLLARRDKIHEYVEEDLDLSGLATAEQGAKADTAIQADSLASAEVTTGSDTRTLAEWAGAVRKRIVQVDSIEGLLAINTAILSRGQQVSALSYHPPVFPAASFNGGGDFHWDSTKPKSDHNGGTIISATVPWTSDTAAFLAGDGETDSEGAGCFVRSIEGVISVAAYGAISSANDNWASINAALVNHSNVYLPPYQYKVSQTVTVPELTKFVGDGTRKSIIRDNGVTGPLMQMGEDGVSTNAVCVEGIGLYGSIGEASPTSVGFSANYATNCKMNDVRCVGGNFVDGFYFRYVWPGEFISLATNGGSISRTCFHFDDEVNACTFDGLYTSNFCETNILIDGSGHGNTLNAPSAQGGRSGFYVRTVDAFGGWTVNSLYTENTPRPIVLGERGSATTTSARYVKFVGGSIAAAETDHPQYDESIAAIELNSAVHCSFEAMSLLSVVRSGGGFPTVSITGDGTGAVAVPVVDPEGAILGVIVTTPGTGYTSATAEVVGGGGTGAELSVTVGDGKISGVVVTVAGSGYKRTQTPFAVYADTAFGVEFSAMRADIGVSSVLDPFYPYIIRNDTDSNVNSTLRVSDHSNMVSSAGGKADVITVSGGGYKFAIIEYGSGGEQIINTHTALRY